jgi:hypothetical protein
VAARPRTVRCVAFLANSPAIGLLAYWLIGLLAYWLIGLLAYWLIDWADSKVKCNTLDFSD